MKPEFERQITAILKAVRNLPGEQRVQAAEDLCGDDGKLAATVLEHLGKRPSSQPSPELGTKGAPMLLPDTALDAALPKKATAGTATSGREIGPYRILEKIGEGGMGEVYLAEQIVPVRRQVAAKVIREGMGTDEVTSRFVERSGH